MGSTILQRSRSIQTDQVAPVLDDAVPDRVGFLEPELRRSKDPVESDNLSLTQEIEKAMEGETGLIDIAGLIALPVMVLPLLYDDIASGLQENVTCIGQENAIEIRVGRHGVGAIKMRPRDHAYDRSHERERSQALSTVSSVS
ncbi:hypothetical protein AA0535_2472 [Asaia krungthepensis NRIC 0535]|uniref:Uncharacterized protein n=2 Tax=Asaia krungthepensis TaxID=220990 RepID=A0ABQ0Q5D9_9PROT|nr:hypothetical protein AA0535_2472 [Asaia krungthepensis NRIC 0535]